MAISSTKEKLLKAALDLFSEKGYEATSVDEIAASVGLKGPSIYKYFKGKEALFQEISELSEEEYRKGMVLDSDPTELVHTAEQLKQFSIEQVIFTINNETIHKLRRVQSMEQFRNSYIREKATLHQHSTITGLFTRIFKSLINEGKIEPCDPALLAQLYSAPIALMIQLYDREPERKNEVMMNIMDHIDFFIDKFFKKDTRPND